MKRITFERHWSDGYSNSWKSVLFLIALMAVVITTGRLSKLLEVKTVEAEEVTQKVDKLESEKKTLQAKIPVTKVPTQAEIESYIAIIFGMDAKVAVAVSHHECSPSNKQYPFCVMKSDKEYSVGVFQINLFNKEHWIHAFKVPGETMEAKIEWLKDPYHNTLIAYKIFKDRDNFTAWSAFTNGSYQLSLKGGE